MESGGVRFVCALNTLISTGGTNSSHTHNDLAKSQSYQGLQLLLRDTNFMKTVNSMLIYYKFQEN